MKVTTLKGIFPDPKPLGRKNFIHENVKNLRRMEQCFQANKEVDELQKLQLRKCHRTVDKYQNVSARVITNFQEKKKLQSNNTAPKDNSILTNKMESKKHQSQDEIGESDAKPVVASESVFRTKMDSNTSSKQKKQQRTSKRNETYSKRKIQPKVSSAPNVIHKFRDTRNNPETHSNTVKYKNQGVQTLDTDQIESIYSEGIIRSPSKNITNHKDVVSDINSNEQEEKALGFQSDSPANRGDMHTPEDLRKLDLRNTVSPTNREQVDFVKLNKEYTSVANKLAMQLNNSTPPAHYRKGVVPKYGISSANQAYIIEQSESKKATYLRERKEAQQKELKAKAEASHPDCPDGHIPLPDHERKETLQLLKKNYQQYIDELNVMPIKTDTLRAQRRKMEIERQLTKLEEGIKVFSRPKVFVKINA